MSSVTPHIPYETATGDGTTTVVAYSFPILSSDDLVVTIDGVVTTAYTLTGVGSSVGGTITFTTAPANGAAIVKYRSTALRRDTEYQYQGDFRADVVNPDFNRLWYVLMEIVNGTRAPGASVRAPIGETLTALPTADLRALKLLSFDADGNPAVVAASAQSAAALSLDLADNTSATKGPALVTHNASKAYTAFTVGAKLLESISVKDYPYGATGDGATDDTAAIQAALDASARVYLPPGVYLVDPVVGLKIGAGQQLIGAGRNRTILLAKSGGGTSAQLVAYTQGSLIKRRFNPSITVTGGTWTITTFTSTDGAAQTFRIFNQTATNHSAKTVTITGTDANGAAQSEVLAMPAGNGAAYSVKKYLTVTTLAPSASIGADTMKVCLENPYVTDVYLADFSVVLTHPTSSVTTTGIQIAVDMRNVTRSTIERLHVGNIAPISPAYVKASNGAYDIQGYGIVIGNVSSNEPSYCGGEVITVRDTAGWGAHKVIVQDDATLSPLSSAHAVTVANCDLQAGHHLLVQESQYTAGCSWRDNVIQNAVKQPGDASSAYIARFEGYNSEMTGGYIEAGSAADYILRLGSTSKTNHFRLTYYSATNTAAISDAGTRNEVEYFENSGSIAGGVDPFGAPVRLYDKAYRAPWVKFKWDGSAIVIDGSQGIASVTRTGTGDYTVTFSKTFVSDDYPISVALDTNASGHGGTFSIGSHSASNMRIYTFAQNGATTTAIDPRFVWVRAGQ